MFLLWNCNKSQENTEKPPFYGIPDTAKPLLEKPTQVLKIKNVVWFHHFCLIEAYHFYFVAFIISLFFWVIWQPFVSCLFEQFKQEEFLLLSESELEETLEDVRLECARYVWQYLVSQIFLLQLYTIPPSRRGKRAFRGILQIVPF